jgi:hypothetical protein
MSYAEQHSERGRRQVAIVPPHNRVIRWHESLVGSDLSAVLRWCETHVEPVWVHNDGSYECPQTLVVEWDTKDHVIVDPPWEAPHTASSTEGPHHPRGDET